MRMAHVGNCNKKKIDVICIWKDCAHWRALFYTSSRSTKKAWVNKFRWNEANGKRKTIHLTNMISEDIMLDIC